MRQRRQGTKVVQMGLIPGDFQSPLPMYHKKGEWTALKDRAVVILANSPALVHPEVEHHLAALGRSVITIGINRIMRAFRPDYFVVCDDCVLVDEFEDIVDYPGQIGVWEGAAHNRRQLNRTGSRLSETWDRPTAAQWLLQPTSLPYVKAWDLPKRAGDPILRVGSTALYAFQLISLLQPKVIGMIGCDFNAPLLAKKAQATHFYGRARHSNGCGNLGTGAHHECTWWFVHVCRLWAKGVAGVGEVFNLSPYSDAMSPFSAVSRWPRLRIEEFIDRYGM